MLTAGINAEPSLTVGLAPRLRTVNWSKPPDIDRERNCNQLPLPLKL